MKKTIVWILIGVIMTLAIGRASTNSFQDDVKQYIAYGWMEEPEVRTWTYVDTITTASADVYLVHVNEDVTGLIGPNLKVRLYNPTVKYFGVLSVGAYADGVTPVYLFGGTDYVLDGLEAISTISFSSAKAPIGFPMSEDKWVVEFEDATLITDSTVVNNEYKNQGSYSLTMPAGLWNVSYRTKASAQGYEENQMAIVTVLSTSSATTSSTAGNYADTMGKAETGGEVPVGHWRLAGGFMSGRFVAELSSETTIYLKYMPDGNVGTDFVILVNKSDGSCKTIIRAVWGGL